MKQKVNQAAKASPKVGTARKVRQFFLSLTSYYSFGGGTWGIIKILLGQSEYARENLNINFIAITLTLFIFSFFGDLIVGAYLELLEFIGVVMLKEYLWNQNHLRLLIYTSYVVVLFLVYSLGKNDSVQLWVNSFATYVAFDRVKSNWHLIKDRNFQGL